MQSFSFLELRHNTREDDASVRERNGVGPDVLSIFSRDRRCGWERIERKKGDVRLGKRGDLMMYRLHYRSLKGEEKRTEGEKKISSTHTWKYQYLEGVKREGWLRQKAWERKKAPSLTSGPPGSSR